MSLHMVFDAAVPPATAPSGAAGVLGYIGGADATHTWTAAEWARFGALVKFPAWVPNLRNHAGNEAVDIVNALNRAGWLQQKSPANAHYVVVIDYEAAGQAEAEWHSHLGQALGVHDYTAVAYGSLSTVMLIGAAEVWQASWNGQADLQPGAQTVHGHQYTANAKIHGDTAVVDYSTVDDWLFARGRR